MKSDIDWISDIVRNGQLLVFVASHFGSSRSNMIMEMAAEVGTATNF